MGGLENVLNQETVNECDPVFVHLTILNPVVDGSALIVPVGAVIVIEVGYLIATIPDPPAPPVPAGA